MVKIIVFGNEGMLGNYIYKYLKSLNKYNIIGINRSKYDAMNNSSEKLKDILLKNVINCNQEVYVINCIGLIPHASKNYMINDKMYIKINSIFPQILSQICVELKIKMIHVTTDCVYNGDKGNYIETDDHNETNIYGITKSLGEPDNCMVIRTSIIGEELKNKRSLVEWLKSNKGGTIKGYSNHYWNGITCLEFAKILDNVINSELYWIGVRHIFSPNVVSKYDLLRLVNKIYNLNIKIQKYDEGIKKVDKTMCSIYDNMIQIKSISEQIEELKAFNIL